MNNTEHPAMTTAEAIMILAKGNTEEATKTADIYTWATQDKFHGPVTWTFADGSSLTISGNVIHAASNQQ